MKSLYLLPLLLTAGGTLHASDLNASRKLIALDEISVQKLIASQKGKVVLVNFWATWCEPCRAEMPVLAAMESRLRPKGLKLLVISADEPEKEAAARTFLEAKRIPFPAYLKEAKSDEKFIDSIDSNWSGALPALFLYDRAGKRVKTFIGETNPKEVEAAIQKLL